MVNRTAYRQIPVIPRDKYVVGLDIGQSIDPSAVCVLQHTIKGGDWQCDDANQIWRQEKIERFFVRHLERLPLQMPYPEQMGYIINLLSRDPLKGATFALDFTGVGRPVADSFARAGIQAENILITSGSEVSRVGASTWHVPKGILVSEMEARLHSKELRIAAALTEAGPLKEELKDFARKVSETGRVQYSARSGRHDDLILSICIGLFISLNEPTCSFEALPF